MAEQFNVEWKYAFRRINLIENKAIQFDDRKNGGVYLYILKGDNGFADRIVYVGTANKRGFLTRWSESAKAFLLGSGTIFKVAERKDGTYKMLCDVYKLMMNDHGIPYRGLTEENKLWLPNKPEGGYYKNYYDNNSFKDTDWVQYAKEFYLKQSDIWYCVIDDKRISEVLETQLQKALGKKYRLQYYSAKSQNWLGRQEVKEKDVPLLKSRKFVFNTLPEGLPDETKEVLNNMLNYID